MIMFYTDGSCRKNPGPGGFGVVVMNDQEPNVIKYTYSEQCEHTTNNREELKAILHAFEIIEKEHIKEATVYSDSAYCVNMLNEWIFNWAKNDWKNSKKQTVENIDLVQSLYKYVTKNYFYCQVMKVKGHNGNVYNELADALATDDSIKFAKILQKEGLSENPIEIFKNL